MGVLIFALLSIVFIAILAGQLANLFMIAFIATVVGLIAYRLGYEKAHEIIAAECKKLGKFFIIDEVFNCTKIEKKANED